MKAGYRLRGSTEYQGEVVDLAYRRVRPFLDMAGMQTRSLEHLMAEAYMQGIKDAADAVTKRRAFDGRARPDIDTRGVAVFRMGGR